jgi:preprotein translocase subunit YajC
MSNNNDMNAITVSEVMPESPPEVTQGTFTSLIPLVLIFVVFYFLLIRPQEKKRREQEDLVSTVKKGEEIVTHSGIYGVVTRVIENDPTIEVSIAKDVNIKILKSAIATIVSRQIPEAKVSVKKNKGSK